MKLCMLAILLIILVTPPSVCYLLTVVASIVWLIYTICYIIRLNKIKDKKEKIDSYSMYPPNNNYASCIRYLYSGKIDFKVFISTLFELIDRDKIRLLRKNKNEYYFVYNKENYGEITKNENEIINLLFKKIGDGECVSLSTIKKCARGNSGYFYAIYKEWQNIFSFESAKYKYFKPIKPIIDSSLLYFLMSLAIVIYNILFTKFIVLALIIFYVTSYLTIEVNNYSNRETNGKLEYVEWLKFKNNLHRCDNNLEKIDIKSLENYAMYAYVLDEYESFVKILYKKYKEDSEFFKDSIILLIFTTGIFEDIEKDIRKSISVAKWKTVLLFLKNKGKRV